MIFDQLVGMIERSGSPVMMQMAEEAHLFHFPIDSRSGVLPTEFTPEQHKYLCDEFALPFPVTAIEDNESCVIIKPMKPELFGVNQPWLCCEYVPPEKGEDCEFSLLNLGIIMAFEPQSNRITIHGTLGDLFSFIINPKKKEIIDQTSISETDDSERACGMRRIAFRNWIAAIEELLMLNQPERFILETSPVKQRKNPKKILRSQDRPIYTILRPAEIRERMKLDTVIVHDRASPRGHERRAYYKTLRSERFVKARGRRLFIPATWVGPSENIHGHRRYRVLLDK